MKALGLGIFVIGIVIMGFAAIPSLGSIGGGSGEEVCDVSGTLLANAVDRIIDPYVADIAFSPPLESHDCRPASFLDGLGQFSIASPPPADLIHGNVKITVVVYEGSEKVRSQQFDIETKLLQNAPISRDVKFSALEHGSYTAKIYTSWAGQQPVKEFSFTV